MKGVLTVLFFQLLAFSNLQAQNFHVGVVGKANMPVSDFREKSQTHAFPGISVLLLYSFPYQPVEIGLSVGYEFYGTDLEKRTDLFPDSNDSYRLRKYHNIWPAMAHFRYYPEDLTTLPLFLELQAGALNINTRYAIRERATDDPIERGRILRDWVMGYGAGIGWNINLSKEYHRDNLEIKLIYRDSLAALFLKRGQAQFDPTVGQNGEFVFTPHRAPINVVELSVGFVFRGMPIR